MANHNVREFLACSRFFNLLLPLIPSYKNCIPGAKEHKY